MQDLERLFGLQRRLAFAFGVGVRLQGVLQFGRDADVVDDDSAGFVFEDSVHAGDGLHQVVIGHRFIDVHRVAAGSVEARQPHVADDHDFQFVAGVLESLFESLLGSFGIGVLLQVGF